MAELGVSSGSTHDRRSEIVTAVSEFFREEIAIEDRCVDFLSRRPNRKTLLPELVQSEPAILNAWHRCRNEVRPSVTLAPLQHDSIELRPDPSRRTPIIDLLNESFLPHAWDQRLPSDAFTTTATSILKSRTLSCVDFVFSCFDEAWTKTWMMDLEVTGVGARALYADNIADAGGVFWEQYSLEPARGRQLFVVSCGPGSWQLRPVAFFGGYRSHRESHQTEGSAIGRICVNESDRYLGDALNELEYLIRRDAKENAFQAFFERNQELLLLALGAQHRSVHCQLVLYPESEGTRIPDFFLERLDTGMCDILDLKRPNAALQRRVRNRLRFRDVVMDAVAQLEGYRNYFEDRRNREDFQRRYGLKAYRPRVIAIIGRASDNYEEIERVQASGLLPSHFEFLTYDDILSRVRHLSSLLRRTVQ